MPRLASSLIARARNISPLLPLLLQTCRTLPSAHNELRWLREHVSSLSNSGGDNEQSSRALLLQLCRQRARGVPLQYLLGSQPFGELDILCRTGVLIPRPETEAYTAHLASVLIQDLAPNGPLNLNANIRILDLCTGTGCIPLFLHAALHAALPKLELTLRGVDVSSKALVLAKTNLAFNFRSGNLDGTAMSDVSFKYGDVLSPSLASEACEDPWDVVISNPPYISASGFATSTARSVRNFEPKLALVPPMLNSHSESSQPDFEHPEDLFYPRILCTARNAHAQVVLMEVADLGQALRVVEMSLQMGHWREVEIWKDWPEKPKNEFVDLRERRVLVKGEGEGRAVVCRR